MSAERKVRLESLLHREIATVVQNELRDPRLGFITITRVEMTADLQQVKAYFSVLGGERERKLAKQALDAARQFVQSRYAAALTTRLLPILSFHPDVREEKRADMADLIRRARASDSDHGERPEPPAAQPGQPPANGPLPQP